jgi:hypothetical protein
MAGVDLRTVAELMGHQTIQMTMRYAHLAPAHTLAAVERLVVSNRESERREQAGEAKVMRNQPSATKSATSPEEGVWVPSAPVN